MWGGNFRSTNQKHYQDLGSARHQCGISALVTQKSFCDGSSGDLAKRRLFSQAELALFFFILKRDRCIQPSVELPGLWAFVRAISPLSICLAGISLVQLVGLFVRVFVILFVRSFTAFVCLFCVLSFGHMACAFIHCLQP